MYKVYRIYARVLTSILVSKISLRSTAPGDSRSVFRKSTFPATRVARVKHTCKWYSPWNPILSLSFSFGFPSLLLSVPLPLSVPSPPSLPPSRTTDTLVVAIYTLYQIRMLREVVVINSRLTLVSISNARLTIGSHD